MLDLNLNAEMVESTQNSDSVALMEKYEYHGRQHHHPYYQPEGSGTSNSSIVNVDALSNDDSCSMVVKELYSFNFDILKASGGGDENENENENNAASVVVTKELGVSNEKIVGVEGGLSRNWIDLSFERRQEIGDSGRGRGGGEVRVMPQTIQQVKKSRRGPKSKNQFRKTQKPISKNLDMWRKKKKKKRERGERSGLKRK